MRITMTAALFTMAAALLVALAGTARADDVLHLSIKNHRFEPEQLDVPAGVKFKLMVKNEDDTPEEFESSQLHREKIVPPGKEIPLFLGPLDKGDYKFVGDYHQATAKGVLTAK
jgi:Cupredoxin-like domain